MVSKTAREYIQNYSIPTKFALFRQTGDWYHILKGFPGALIDKNGYILFKTKIEYDEFIETNHMFGVRQNIKTNTLTIRPRGISQFHQYTEFVKSLFPDEKDEHSITLFEGARIKVYVNSFERNSIARTKAIKKWGTSCIVCAFNFEEKFGLIGKGYIHVHHLIPLSTIRSSYEVDPENDLIPVCPNCHAMLHTKDPPYSVDELRTIIETVRSQTA